MKHLPDRLRVREGGEVKLKVWPTSVDALYRSKAEYHELLAEHTIG